MRTTQELVLMLPLRRWSRDEKCCSIVSSNHASNVSDAETTSEKDIRHVSNDIRTDERKVHIQSSCWLWQSRSWINTAYLFTFHVVILSVVVGCARGGFIHHDAATNVKSPEVILKAKFFFPFSSLSLLKSGSMISYRARSLNIPSSFFSASMSIGLSSSRRRARGNAHENDDNNDEVMFDLAGKVAIVTGATRGIGKGIALELGRAGCEVYVAGRSSRQTGGPTDERYLGQNNDDCTIERTAEEINEMKGSGCGVPMRCDVRDLNDITALVEQVRNSERGRLDIVVASAFQTPSNVGTASFRNEFWKDGQGEEMWDCCHGIGLRGAYLTCREAAPLMIETAAMDAQSTNAGYEKSQKQRPLMVLISSFGGKSYTFNVAYGVGKAGCDRLASDMATQLLPHGVDVVSLYPGVVRTEGNIALEERGEWAEASGGLDLSPGNSESPRFTGRAVACLASDTSKMEGRSGKVVVVAELAKEMGFTDIDGLTPPSIRSMKFLLPNFAFPQIEKESGNPVPSWIKDNVPDILLPWSIFTDGPPPTKE